MGWFDDNALPAGVSREAAEDFIARNPGDYSRIASALGGSTSHRPYDSQTTDASQQAANRAADVRTGGVAYPSGGSSGYGSAGGAGMMGGYGVTLPQVPYTPFTQTFTPSLGALPGDLMKPWDRTFQAPDASKLASDPVVQARLSLGRDAFEKSAAATGTLRTGGFAQGLEQFGQQVATDEYSKIYDRAMQEFQGAYGMFQGDKTTRAGIYGDQWSRDFGQYQNQYNISRNNQLDPFGMGTALYGLGQTDRRLSQDDQRIGLAQQESQFGQNRTTRMDDFSMWAYGDTNYYDRLFRAAELGQPR